MALHIQRDIIQDIQDAKMYTIMADESSDVSNKEQLVFCVRWVDAHAFVHEDFIGMHPMKGTDADQIVALIKVDAKIFSLQLKRDSVLWGLLQLSKGTVQ